MFPPAWECLRGASLFYSRVPSSEGSRPSSLPENGVHGKWHKRLVCTHVLHTSPKLGMSNLRVPAFQCGPECTPSSISMGVVGGPWPSLSSISLNDRKILPPHLTLPQISVLLPRRLGPQVFPPVSWGQQMSGGYRVHCPNNTR